MTAIKKYHPTLKVITGHKWLFEMFNGTKNKKGTAILEPVIDPDGNPIIGKQILTSTDFDIDIEIKNPLTSETTTPRNEMWEIPYCYLETPEEI